jgi:hypothetical protein
VFKNHHLNSTSYLEQIVIVAAAKDKKDQPLQIPDLGKTFLDYSAKNLTPNSGSIKCLQLSRSWAERHHPYLGDNSHSAQTPLL